MIKLIRKMTPDFQLNINWQNLRLSDHFSHRLKMTVPSIEKTSTVYKMQCVSPCSHSYIGESKRTIHQRVMEHRRLQSSAIQNHITSCEHYEHELTKKYGVEPTRTEKILILENLFEPVILNATNYHARKRMEAISIVLFKPSLNNQDDF